VTVASPTCDGPIKEFPLTVAADTTTRVCNDAPCSKPINPGDTMLNTEPLTTSALVSKGRFWTNPGDVNNLQLTNMDDCKGIYPGDVLAMYFQPGNSDFFEGVSSTTCNANQKTVTVTGGNDFSFAASTGVPYFLVQGVQTERFGFLLRKKSTTASSTIKINSVRWVMASYIQLSLGFGSGGFGQRCTHLADSNGYYHCHAGNSVLYAIKVSTTDNVTADIRYLGLAQVNPAALFASGENQNSYCDGGGNDFLWDDSDPNVFYCMLPSNYPNPNTGGNVDNRPIMARLTLTGNDVPVVPDPTGRASISRLA